MDSIHIRCRCRFDFQRHYLAFSSKSEERRNAEKLQVYEENASLKCSKQRKKIVTKSVSQSDFQKSFMKYLRKPARKNSNKIIAGCKGTGGNSHVDDQPSTENAAPSIPFVESLLSKLCTTKPNETYSKSDEVISSSQESEIFTLIGEETKTDSVKLTKKIEQSSENSCSIEKTNTGSSLMNNAAEMVTTKDEILDFDMNSSMGVSSQWTIMDATLEEINSICDWMETEPPSKHTNTRCKQKRGPKIKRNQNLLKKENLRSEFPKKKRGRPLGSKNLVKHSRTHSMSRIKENMYCIRDNSHTNKGKADVSLVRPIFARNWIIRRPFACYNEKKVEFVMQETYPSAINPFTKDMSTENPQNLLQKENLQSEFPKKQRGRPQNVFNAGSGRTSFKNSRPHSMSRIEDNMYCLRENSHTNKGKADVSLGRPMFSRNWIIRRPFACYNEKKVEFVMQETYPSAINPYTKDMSSKNPNSSIDAMETSDEFLEL